MASGGSPRVQRDADALAQLFETCYDRVARYMVARYMVARVGNPAIAEDLAGDCFVRAAVDRLLSRARRPGRGLAVPDRAQPGRGPLPPERTEADHAYR